MEKVEFAPILTLDEFVKIRNDLEGSLVLTSGGFDPLHPGHISCIADSKTYGDFLAVVVNGDWFLDYKKGKHLMDLKTRSEIISAIRGVDFVIPFEIEEDITVNESLRKIQPDVFTKGGDRMDVDTIPEWEVCCDYGIQIVTGVGDSKTHSSSNILEDWYYHRLRQFIA